MPLGDWTVFVLAAFAAAMVPGPVSLAAMTIGARGRPAEAVFGGLGNVTASLLQVAAALGIVVLAVENLSPVFRALALGGGVYLIWLAAGLLPAGPGAAAKPAPLGRDRVFGRVFVLTAMNPKALMFFVALFPQLVTRGMLENGVWAGGAVVAISFAIVAFAAFLLNAGLGATLSALVAHPALRAAARLTVAALFATLGAMSILSGLTAKEF